MKSAKKLTLRNSPSPVRDFKIGVILLFFVAIPFVLLLFLLFLFKIAPFVVLFSSSREVAQTESGNSAKPLAAIMIPFERQYHLKKLYEMDIPLGSFLNDNRNPWFEYIYQGSLSLSQANDLITQYLESHGYVITEKLHNSDPDQAKGGNADQPWWELNGEDDKKDTVHVEITDKTFYNTYDIQGIDQGIYHIPHGLVFIVVTFTKGVSI